MLGIYNISVYIKLNKGREINDCFISAYVSARLFWTSNGTVLLCIKRTRKAGLITTLSPVTLGIIFTIVLEVGGYNATKEAVDRANSESDTSVSHAAEEESSDDSATDDGIIDSKDYLTDWTSDRKGLKTSIEGVSIFKVDPTKLEEDGEEGKGLIVISYKIKNTSDIDFDTYPDQGVLVVNGKQIDASSIQSDDIGGEIMKDVTNEGTVVYVLPTLSHVNDIKNIRLKWDSGYDTDDLDDDSFKTFDAQLILK